VRELGRWPTKGELLRAGLRPALAAVYDHGGSAAWRRRLGVKAAPFGGPLPNRRRWTSERIEAELRRFCRLPASSSAPEAIYRRFEAQGFAC